MREVEARRLEGECGTLVELSLTGTGGFAVVEPVPRADPRPVTGGELLAVGPLVRPRARVCTEPPQATVTRTSRTTTTSGFVRVTCNQKNPIGIRGKKETF